MEVEEDWLAPNEDQFAPGPGPSWADDLIDIASSPKIAAVNLVEAPAYEVFTSQEVTDSSSRNAIPSMTLTGDSLEVPGLYRGQELVDAAFAVTVFALKKKWKQETLRDTVR